MIEIIIGVIIWCFLGLYMGQLIGKHITDKKPTYQWRQLLVLFLCGPAVWVTACLISLPEKVAKWIEE